MESRREGKAYLLSDVDQFDKKSKERVHVEGFAYIVRDRVYPWGGNHCLEENVDDDTGKPAARHKLLGRYIGNPRKCEIGAQEKGV